MSVYTPPIPRQEENKIGVSRQPGIVEKFFAGLLRGHNRGRIDRGETWMHVWALDSPNPSLVTSSPRGIGIVKERGDGVGWLMRTKDVESDEREVAEGFSALDSVMLVNYRWIHDPEIGYSRTF
ncbi:hypothetical protein PAXINDRAFT_17158 [Paxillus involutus ATCC 200175]|uniref:Uncharacterized protein n=1 Tax=Paxillus involutus ATCC 200175 TaxID=664439 RepID=A0A0C9SQQ2_PAXIN|nr:hypothetical protein PAXINDRAFT_17158 [Paxillus involutus ATCC 200175]